MITTFLLISINLTTTFGVNIIIFMTTKLQFCAQNSNFIRALDIRDAGKTFGDHLRGIIRGTVNTFSKMEVSISSLTEKNFPWVL